jgi:hypothetical protein
MTKTDEQIRTGLGLLVEASPEAPTLEEAVAVPRRRRGAAFGYGFAVIAMTLVIALGFTVAGGQFTLAYAIEPGLQLNYRVGSVATTGGETFRTEATLGYEIHSLSGAEDVTVEVFFLPADQCANCFQAVKFTQVVAADGTIVSIDLPEGSEIPESVLPTPIPHTGASGSFPLFIGPPLPDEAVGVGDQWTTSLNGVAGTHQLVSESEIQGLEVVVIESSYSFTPTAGTNGERITASTTVWFDPLVGIVVRAELTRNETSPTIEVIETTYELID